MGRIANFVKTIRNNWKKSLFGAGLLAYGVDYGVDSYHVTKLMRTFCEEAVKFGDEPVQIGKLRRITVILNPAANNKKAKKNFDLYCAPLLHLSGVYVTVLETEREGHARELVDSIPPSTDAIVVAGGDGTLSETITGLMRSRGELCKIPIGVLPLGSRNSVASGLFEEAEQHKVVTMANATLAVVKGNVRPIDAFRVEVLNTDPEMTENPRPVYGVGSVEWGLRRELRKKSDSLWWMGPLKGWAPLIFHSPYFHIAQNTGFIEANIRYSPPCGGCNNCYQQRADLRREAPTQQSSRWWNIMSLENRRTVTQNVEPVVDYTAIANETCTVVKETKVITSDLNITITDRSQDHQLVPKLVLEVGPEVKYQGELLTEGFKILKDEKSVLKDVIEAKQLEIRPLESTSQPSATEEVEDNLSIDNEDFEVRPIRVSILPNSVRVFCK
uniref:Acylglycerol kinase, mitochondrial n=1 Tax=Lygus hesperus TaxID=30085 RepID=A0A0A9Y733_LYGHE